MKSQFSSQSGPAHLSIFQKNHSGTCRKGDGLLGFTLVFLCILLLSACPRPALAQSSSSVIGTVRDSSDQGTLPGAYVILTSLADSLKAVSVTDDDGQFHFGKIKTGEYSLKVSFLGYRPFEKRLDFKDTPINMGNIDIAPEHTLLKGVLVKGQVPLSEQKGDTTEFNSQAYKTTADASAEDLVRKMPGIVVQNGKVQAQGEDVQEVTVDGKKFFGNDPSLALKNLPAEVIDKIQVFDKLSDQAQFSGFDDGQTTKTINIVTRQDRRNGQFGKVFAGAGNEGTYQAGGSVNVFNGDQRISVIGQANNINQQNFSTQDLLGVVGSAGGRGGRRGGGGSGGGGGRGGSGGGGRGGYSGGSSINNFMVGQQNGISTTNALGLNFNDNWGKKVEFNGSYFFNNSKNVADQLSNQQYFLPNASDQFYNEDYTSISHNYNNRLDMRVNYKIDSANTILFVPSVNFQTNKSLIDLNGTTTQDDQMLSQSSNTTSNSVKGYNISNLILYRHRFDKPGRTLSVQVRTGNNQNDGDKTLLAANNFYNTKGATMDTVNQRTGKNTDGFNLSSRVVYTEPISKSSQLMANYSISYNNGNSDKRTLNFDESRNGYFDLDSTLSNQFNSKYTTQLVGAGYRLHADKLFMTAELNYQIAGLDNQQYFPGQDKLHYTFQNFMPMGMLMYRFNRQKNLRVFYRTSTDNPSVNQLQNVLDNSNPLQLSIGNPTLDQQYQHSVFIRYSSSSVDRSNTFFAMLGGGLTDHYITNATYITSKDTVISGYQASAGVQLTKPVNMDGYWSMRSFVSYGVPVKALKSNLNLSGSVNLSRMPGMINGVRNITNNVNYGVNLVLSSNISQNLDFTVSSNSSYNTATNSIQAQLNNEYFNQSSRLSLEWIFWKGLVWKTELNHQFYTGLSQGYDQNYLIWNLSLGKKLFKNQRGEILLSVFDLLNQNTNVQRNVTDAYIEDVRTNVLQRFAMLTFTYNLRNFRIKG